MTGQHRCAEPCSSCCSGCSPRCRDTTLRQNTLFISTTPHTQRRAPLELSPTEGGHRGVSRLRRAPGAPLGATLAASADPEQIICVRVQVKNQEFTLPADVGVLVLAPPAARPPVLQPIFRCREVVVHLMQADSTFAFFFPLCR